MFINPLIAWIWIGVAIVVAGTFTALVPSVQPGGKRMRVADSAAATTEVLHA